jgi:hypothetical protein
VEIESDQVVYEYLSRVGDVAQQRQLSSATRMRLVAQLRDEIDRRRAKAVVDSPAAVRRILDRIGSPDDVVAAAGGAGSAPAAPAGAEAPQAAVPVQREAGTSQDTAAEAGGKRRKEQRRTLPGPRPGKARAGSAPSSSGAPPSSSAPSGAADASAARSDWWRTVADDAGLGDGVPGFVGGVEIPDLLKPPPKKDAGRTAPGAAPAAEGEAARSGEQAGERSGEKTARRGLGLLARGLRGRRNPLLLCAAVLLVAGAVLGSWFALALGWVIAYGSRRLTATETKWAVLGMPGLAVVAGCVWLWGRSTGRWGEPVAQDGMHDVLAQTWPWVVRCAAVASALFLVWRSQRQR